MDFDLGDVGEFIHENPQIPIAAGLIAGQAMRRNALQAQRDANAIKKALEQIKWQVEQARKQEYEKELECKRQKALEEEERSRPQRIEADYFEAVQLARARENLRRLQRARQRAEEDQLRQQAQEELVRQQEARGRILKFSRELDRLLNSSNPLAGLSVLRDHASDLMRLGINPITVKFDDQAEAEIARSLRRRMLQLQEAVAEYLIKELPSETAATLDDFESWVQLCDLFDSLQAKGVEIRNFNEQLASLRPVAKPISHLQILRKLVGPLYILAYLVIAGVLIFIGATQGGFLTCVAGILGFGPIILSTYGMVSNSLLNKKVRFEYLILAYFVAAGFVIIIASTGPAIAACVAGVIGFGPVIWLMYQQVNERLLVQTTEFECWSKAADSATRNITRLLQEREAVLQRVAGLDRIDRDIRDYVLTVLFPSQETEEFTKSAKLYCDQLRGSLGILGEFPHLTPQGTFVNVPLFCLIQSARRKLPEQ
jgi:hypothetical protein